MDCYIQTPNRPRLYPSKRQVYVEGFNNNFDTLYATITSNILTSGDKNKTTVRMRNKTTKIGQCSEFTFGDMQGDSVPAPEFVLGNDMSTSFPDWTYMYRGIHCSEGSNYYGVTEVLFHDTRYIYTWVTPTIKPRSAEVVFTPRTIKQKSPVMMAKIPTTKKTRNKRSLDNTNANIYRIPASVFRNINISGIDETVSVILKENIELKTNDKPTNYETIDMDKQLAIDIFETPLHKCYYNKNTDEIIIVLFFKQRYWDSNVQYSVEKDALKEITPKEELLDWLEEEIESYEIALQQKELEKQRRNKSRLKSKVDKNIDADILEINKAIERLIDRHLEVSEELALMQNK